MIALSLLIALAPGLFLIWYFNHRDKYEPEPKRKILKIFLLGALMVIPAAVAEPLLVNAVGKFAGGLLNIFIISFFIIAPIEEILKYFAVRWWIYRSIEFNEIMDGIVYAVSASLGFATLENLLYVFHLGLTTGIMRAFFAVPAHACFGALMGYYMGQAKFNHTQESKLINRGVVLAILFHGIYDFLSLIQSSFSSLVIFLLVILFLWIRNQLRRAEIDSRIRTAQDEGIDN
jgi:RsiW-degrading membrane proteinase PrsW (M82 family)